MRLEGKVALITGAAHGLGAEEARMFALEGAKVVVTDIDDNEGSKVAGQILDSDGAAIFVHLDVTKEADWKDAVGSTITAFGALNILVNNAGISGTGVKDFGDTRVWDSLMEVNITGSYLDIKYVVREMRKSGGGSIVNISSILGLTGLEKLSAYCASKGAVRLFTKAVALECGRNGSGIRVNSIHPGYIRTAMVEDTCRRDYSDISTGLAELGKLHPIGRIGEPEEIAAGVLYLASDESKFVTGSELAIDGGYTAA